MSDFIWPSDQDRADDELNRVCNELEDVMAQAKSDEQMTHIYRVENIKLTSERDALKAHLSAVKSAFQQDESPIDPDGVLHHVMMRAPDASLARRDARIVADALDNLLPVAKNGHHDYIVETLETNIAHLRRQAEEEDQ